MRREKWANTGSGISVSEVNRLHLQITRSVQTGRVFCCLSVMAEGFDKNSLKQIAMKSILKHTQWLKQAMHQLSHWFSFTEIRAIENRKLQEMHEAGLYL